MVKKINAQNEDKAIDEDVLQGTIVDDAPVDNSKYSPEKELRTRIESGEWDNLDDLSAFQTRTDEGKLMARTEAIEYRVRQLSARLPMLLDQHLHDAYIQVLKKINALRKTKAALFYFSYKHQGQRDLSGD